MSVAPIMRPFIIYKKRGVVVNIIESCGVDRGRGIMLNLIILNQKEE